MIHLGVSESQAVLAKSLALLQKIKADLLDADDQQFPTNSSVLARDLLLRVLDKLRQPSCFNIVDSAVFFNRLIELNELVEQVLRSATDRISWPLVSHCEGLWHQFFGQNGPQVFFSLTSEHNYRLHNFTLVLERKLAPILTKAERSELLGPTRLYCLELASAEDYNLPLYANIGHEFGHAVYDERMDALIDDLNGRSIPLLAILNKELEDADKTAHVVDRRRRSIGQSIAYLGMELFCDAVGAFLMGPAFFLSLFEMFWGQDRSACRIFIPPNISTAGFGFIKAYPSPNFRLACAKKWAKVDDFCKSAAVDFKQIPEQLRELASILQTVPIDTTNDTIKGGVSDDGMVLQNLLSAHRVELEKILESHAEESVRLLKIWYPLACNCSTSETAELLERLASKILPNSVGRVPKDGCASFVATLTASALYRLHVITTIPSTNVELLARETGIVERLSAKAFEVSFIQRAFADWTKRQDAGGKETA